MRSWDSWALLGMTNIILLEEEVLKQVMEVSDDSKNNSLEFNEFLKMIALDMKSDATKNKKELLDAFK